MALIRAVGHVLKEVDGADSRSKSIIEGTYFDWKADKQTSEIYWEFITKERNNILKEYLFNLHPNDEVEVIVSLRAAHLATGQLQDIHEAFQIGDNIYRPILDGYREGDDARDVYADAINWWESQLFLIDKALNE